MSSEPAHEEADADEVPTDAEITRAAEPRPVADVAAEGDDGTVLGGSAGTGRGPGWETKKVPAGLDGPEMDRRTLDRLRNRYPGSSWALWSDGFPDEGCVEEDPDALVEFVESNRDRLEPGVVLLGLNPSGELPDRYANFHSPKAKHFDDRLKEFVQENGLDNIAGAYMTDIVPDEVDPDFGNVSPEEADVDRLLDQLEILGRDRFDVVTFSGKAFEILRDCFDAEAAEGCHRISSFSTTWNDATLRVYRVWFYGNWGANADKVPELERQLEHLNDAVAEQVG